MLKNIFTSLLVIAIFSSIIFAQSQRPKNIILLIGDGMGLSQVSSSTISLKNDQFKKFKTIGLINTCAADKLVTDSAAGATAYATGNRTNNGKVGVDVNGKPLPNIFEIAKKKGKSTGVVVTCSLTNATPAAFLAHVDSRKSEFDIAKQISKCNADFLVGAGIDFFASKQAGGKREDGKNYLDSLKTFGYSTLTDTLKISELSKGKKVIGMFGSTMLPHASQRTFTLGQLTESALNSLSKNQNGFVLMIEASQIDWAADQNDKSYLYGEIRDFNTAIEKVLAFAEKNKNTLVVVTSDHDTGSLGISNKNKDTGELDFVWATTKHTANLVGAFSYGPGSNQFNGFMDNWELGKKLINFLK